MGGWKDEGEEPSRRRPLPLVCSIVFGLIKSKVDSMSAHCKHARAEEIPFKLYLWARKVAERKFLEFFEFLPRICPEFCRSLLRIFPECFEGFYVLCFLGHGDH